MSSDPQYVWIVERRAGGIEWPIRDWEVAATFWRAGWRVRLVPVSSPLDASGRWTPGISARGTGAVQFSEGPSDDQDHVADHEAPAEEIHAVAEGFVGPEVHKSNGSWQQGERGDSAQVPAEDLDRVLQHVPHATPSFPLNLAIQRLRRASIS